MSEAISKNGQSMSDLSNERLRRVYYNLRINCYSVQAKTEGRWKVISYEEDVYLENVEFKVYERARLRAVERKVKNVHSFVLGNICEKRYEINLVRVRYNPYINGYYFLEDGSPIYKADYVSLTKFGVFV